jgi:two-component system chemotaxis response regulator CheB
MKASSSEKKPIRVLVVDDSSVIRTILTKILSSDPDIVVVGVAPDPYVARDKIVELQPDVMTLDIEMPRMDGLTFLEKVMAHYPIPTLIVSSLSVEKSSTSLRALELGAVDVVAKPAIDIRNSLLQIGADLIEKVKVAAQAKVGKKIQKRSPSFQGKALLRTTHQVLAIASSTGGTEALKSILPFLPPDIPGTVIVQHMPPLFTRTYAEHLQKLCPFEVKEAQEGDRVIPGRVLIAPGDYHMELRRSGGYYSVVLHQEPYLHGVRPAADYLFKSVAQYAGSNALGLILTGMGKDGAAGLLELKRAGGYTLAQDEASCVVFGMPKVAIEMGAVDSIVSLEQLPDALISQIKKRMNAA